MLLLLCKGQLLDGAEIIEASVGQPWPKPQLVETYGEGFLVIRPSLFRFEVSS